MDPKQKYKFKDLGDIKMKGKAVRAAKKKSTDTIRKTPATL